MDLSLNEANLALNRAINAFVFLVLRKCLFIDVQVHEWVLIDAIIRHICDLLNTLQSKIMLE